MELRKVDVKGFHRLMNPRPTVLVTSIHPETGKPNIITLGWTAPASHRPRLVAVFISTKRYSHDLIAKTKEFVLNVPGIDLVDQVYACGTKSGRNMDKFTLANLTANSARKVKPPIIEECFAHLECKVVDQVRVGDHSMFVGKVVAAYANEDVFGQGMLKIEKVSLIQHLGERIFPTSSKEIMQAK